MLGRIGTRREYAACGGAKREDKARRAEPDGWKI
jgi:hypothetical protein